jgi:polyhydroxyalkanoate synthesis repressor PhaR
MVLVKRYPNRKLYNTDSKQYITLDGIADLIREGTEVQVTDHASGEDLTALTLTQIILEQEKKQSGLLSNSILTGLIRAGGDRLSALPRSLLSSFSPGRLIDEEIKQRILGLVHHGELSEPEGLALIDKLHAQGLRQREEQHAKEPTSAIQAEDIEAYLKQNQIPTQKDLRQLYEQLDELAMKLDDFAESKP